MVHHLGNEFTFKIITLDRDYYDKESYPNIVVENWNTVGNASVYYLPHRNCSFWRYYHLLKNTSHDILHLNGFFSYTFTIKPLILRRLGLTPRCPVILAPRGHFAEGALSLKSFKKRVFIGLAKLVRLYHGVVWHAASASEAQDVARVLGAHQHIYIAQNLAVYRDDVSGQHKAPRSKRIGTLKIVFISRISREKNLDGALRILQGMEGDIQFDLYGPREDMSYWAECEDLIRTLSPKIKVAYKGLLPHDQVEDVFSKYDLFLFPTLGENFGHVILEALISGCPVLISDRTQWRNLEEKQVGCDLPLEDPGRFRKVIYRCINMDSVEHSKWAKAAMEFGAEIARDKGAIEQNRKLFLTALTGASNARSCKAVSDDKN